MVLLSRNLVYSAVYLSLLGVLVAVIIAYLGLPTLGVVHLIVYVGAGALFIVMATLLMREEFPREDPRLRVPSIIIAILSATPLLYLAINSESGLISLGKPDYVYISSEIVSLYSFLVVIIFSVASLALIASIAIAMRRVRR